jgi:hypothetical protein
MVSEGRIKIGDANKIITFKKLIDGADYLPFNFWEGTWRRCRTSDDKEITFAKLSDGLDYLPFNSWLLSEHSSNSASKANIEVSEQRVRKAERLRKQACNGSPGSPGVGPRYRPEFV